jgi:hypothetical protein
MPLATVSASTLPSQTVEVEWNNRVVGNVQLPDWNQISLSDLPGILTAGSFGTEYNQLVGYDLSRIWNVGDTPDRFLKLGDVADALAPQNFTVGNIAQLSGINLSEIALSEFPLIGEQTLSQLVQAVPGLKQVEIGNIAPIQKLLNSNNFSISNLTLGKALAQNPDLGELKLNAIDLSQFSVTSIPHIEQAILGNFNNWKSSLIKDIPGLGQVPLGLMPNPVMLEGTGVARIDAIWGTAESHRYKTVSGSDREGFSVPCENNCAHIELDDLEGNGSAIRGDFEGKQWISGKYQEVSGGSGCLSDVNGGREPTGRHLFGKTFKVVLTEIYESSDSFDTALYFGFCTVCGCSPYFIGPVPFFSYQRDNWIFLSQ